MGQKKTKPESLVILFQHSFFAKAESQRVESGSTSLIFPGDTDKRAGPIILGQFFLLGPLLLPCCTPGF